MALADNPSGWILLLFRKEEQEGRRHLCQRFPDGIEPAELQLAKDERVFGIYRETYFFSPLALHVAGDDGISRIAWSDVNSCTSQHGDGNKTSTLTLADGSTVNIRMADLASGLAGRISQLFHQMIDTFGNQVSLGPTLRPLAEFLASTTDAYALFPNLEPHPDLESLRKSLAHLSQTEGVTDIRVIVPDDDPDTGVGLAICCSLMPDDLTNWASSIGADGVTIASGNLVRQFAAVPEGQRILHAVWD